MERSSTALNSVRQQSAGPPPLVRRRLTVKLWPNGCQAFGWIDQRLN